jgi:murein DD-endopeptidase MepM/ murein hydrolase activator NlpD
VNPVTGTDGFARNPKGEPGHERPGVGGAGYYGAPRRGYAHQGEDISGVSGSSTIHASTSGTVTFSGNKSGYGNTIIIDNGKGVSTLYGHNSENDVRVGSSVQQGERIGVLGQTGNAAGQPPSEAHVHFEVKVDGSRVNPGVWLNSDVDQTFVPAPPPH